MMQEIGVEQGYFYTPPFVYGGVKYQYELLELLDFTGLTVLSSVASGHGKI